MPRWPAAEFATSVIAEQPGPVFGWSVAPKVGVRGPWAAGEVVAVTALWVMDRVALRRAVVKEIWSHCVAVSGQAATMRRQYVP